METRGQFAPETERAAREQYAALTVPAKTVTKEIAEAGTTDRETYRELTTEDVYETAQQALFASLLAVQVGSTEEYEDWLAAHEDLEVVFAGTETVPRRAWHPVWPRAAVVAVSFQNKPEAAVASLRRQAFGRFYRELVAE
ncbi:MAG: DUF5809 family protein [Halobacteriota archaeon]